MAPFLHDPSPRAPWNIYLFVILWLLQFCAALFGTFVALVLLTLISWSETAALSTCLCFSIGANFLVMASVVYEAHHYYMATLTSRSYLLLQASKVLWCGAAFTMLLTLTPSHAAWNMASNSIPFCLPFICGLFYGMNVHWATFRQEEKGIAL